MASRAWVSSASASASRLLRKSPGILARRALPGLFLCAGLLLFFSADGSGPGLSFGARAARAAAWQQPPDVGTPPGKVPGDPGDEGDEEDSTGVFPDTTQLIPAGIGVKPAQPDSTRIQSPAVGIPQSRPPRPDVYGPPAPGSPGEVRVQSGRRGILGLHPAVILLGLVVAHVALIRLVTH